MPVNRYYLDKLFNRDSTVELEGKEYHHLSHVMRASQGERIDLVNGRGQLAKACILKLDKRRAHLQVEEVISKDQPSFEIILAQALPRTNRLHTIIEKGTELGMSQLWLFPGELSERKSFASQGKERLKAVAISAMKQCGRLFLPKIVINPPLCSWKTLDYVAFFGDIDPIASPFSLQGKDVFSSLGVIFFIGPESGFTEKEIAWLKKSKVRGVKLHENILRTDTAPLVALSLIHNLLMLRN